MREVHVSEVTALVRRLCMEANYHLPEDIQQSFVRGKEAEQSPLGKTIFDEMIRNCRLACDQEVPICQDTGTAVIFASVGQDVHLVGGAFEDAVNEGVRQGYTDGYLRKSIVSDPLRRVNTNDNTPAMLHTRLVPGEEIEIIVAPKGGGSENMSALKMFTPAATRDQIVAYIADTVIAAGSNPCPPVIIGVGLGGTADKASELAKRHCCARSTCTARTNFMQRWSATFWSASTSRVSARRDWAERSPRWPAPSSPIRPISQACPVPFPSAATSPDTRQDVSETTVSF